MDEEFEDIAYEADDGMGGDPTDDLEAELDAEGGDEEDLSDKEPAELFQDLDAIVDELQAKFDAMGGEGDMGGDGRKHKRIEKTKYADGGMVATVKFGGGRPAGEVTNKLPKFGGKGLGKITNKMPKFADGGMVTYAGKKNIKIGKGRPIGEVTNKLPKFGGKAQGEVTNKLPKFGGKAQGVVTNKLPKFADGGTVTYASKKNIKIGKGRPIGEVTNKPPKFVGLKPASRELYLGGSKDFDESTGMRRGRPGNVTKIGRGAFHVG